MSNEISFTFNLQFEIPAGQEIKDVSVSFGEVVYQNKIWYCDENGSPYVDHNGRRIELREWPQYYIDNFGRRIEIPSIEKDRIEKQRIRERRLQQYITRRANRVIEEESYWSTRARESSKKLIAKKKINWKEEGF